jgi:hypothetical protein
MSTDKKSIAARIADFEQSGVCPDCLFMGEITIDPMTHGPIGNISHNDFATTVQHMRNGCEVAKSLESAASRGRNLAS